ncbi:sensor domain-containing diguanylate cyclase [Massilia yuzhufengensis]|uniref:PAS domain S-box-containing protein/diguanylate cyclase (GGDEF) domain-containing protein n=1 Tax=Massilia yuzhufengensis TaxID=1164594 RepID=A0A1I1QN86_9BURK|nr:sensor domain-containing diguanylate cyclase [Massilia yuzhufengensis]SFD21308.1 PAS domain S-box-containing protein/diguanylate cyclase (GGDEF) domain-containing protein [Massilia yuzhufengensis]
MTTSAPRLASGNLKLRLASVAAVLVFAATLLVTLSTLAVAERGMKAVIGDQQYTLLSGAASFMDDRLVERLAQVNALATGIPPGMRTDWQAMRPFLTGQVRLWGADEYLNIVVFDGKGDLRLSLRELPGPAALNARGTDYFERTLETRKAAISRPIRSRLTGNHIVIFSAPVLDQTKKVVAVVTASVDLRRSGFLRQISNLKPGKTGYLFLMTAEGVIIDHPDETRLFQHVGATPGVNVGTERALAGFEGWLEARSKDGSDSIYAYKRLRATNWILAARFPTAEAFAPLDAMRRNAFFSAGGLALAAGLLAWVLVFQLLAPLQSLRDNVAAIRADDAGIEVLRDGRRDEIGELGRAFHALMAEREQSERERAASEKRLQLITDNLPVLISYIDREHCFCFGNATYDKWFGVTAAALAGMPIAKVLGEETAADIYPYLEQAFGGHSVTHEVRIPVRGDPRILQATYIPDHQPDGSVAGVYSLVHDMTHVKEVEEQLQQLARVDTLTGIANRRMFGETLHHALDRARRSSKPLGLAYLDIDHFKRINDSHGHGVGDEVLKEFARRLTVGVRATDTPARLSGDEFVVIFEEIGTRAEAERLAGKIVEAMRVPFRTSAGLVQASTSVGLALSQPRLEQEQLLAAADSALYAAKGQGRDGFAFFEG